MKNKEIKKWKFNAILIVEIISIIWGIGYKRECEVLRDQLATMERKLPAEDLTIHIIDEELGKVVGLDTAKYEYSGEFTHPDYRKFLGTDWDVWFTKNEIDVKYEGFIEAGYDIDQIERELDKENKVVKIKLPKAEIKNHNLLQEELLIEENNNCLNPISTADVNELLVKVKEEHLQKAEKDGIYEMAEEQMKSLIINHFDKYLDYTVEFI